MVDVQPSALNSLGSSLSPSSLPLLSFSRNMCYALPVEPECCGESDTAPAGGAVSSGPLGMKEPPPPTQTQKETHRKGTCPTASLQGPAPAPSSFTRLLGARAAGDACAGVSSCSRVTERPGSLLTAWSCVWPLGWGAVCRFSQTLPASGWRWWQGGQKLSTFSLQLQGMHACGGASEHVCPSLGGAQVMGCLQELKVPLTESAGARGIYFKVEVGEIPWWLSG